MMISSDKEQLILFVSQDMKMYEKLQGIDNKVCLWNQSNSYNKHIRWCKLHSFHPQRAIHTKAKLLGHKQPRLQHIVQDAVVNQTFTKF
jgi:hypothetical protein